MTRPAASAKPILACGILLAACLATAAPAQAPGSSSGPGVPERCAAPPAVPRLTLEGPGATQTLFHEGADGAVQVFARKVDRGNRSERGYAAYGLCGLVELWSGEDPPDLSSRARHFRITADRDFPLRAGSAAHAWIVEAGRAPERFELVSRGPATAPPGSPSGRVFEVAYWQGPAEIGRALWSETLRWPIAYHADTPWQVNVHPDESDAAHLAEGEKPLRRFQPNFAPDRH